MAFTGKTWAYPPNWTDDVIERLSWLTDVLPRRDGSEQRRQVRKYPRRVLEYAVLAQTPQLRGRLDNFIWSSQDEAVMVPIWTDATRLSATANSGQANVTVNTTYLDYDTNGYLILWNSPSSYEVVAIQSLTSSTVTLTQNLLATWPAGSTVVAPARLGRFEQRFSGSQIAHDVRQYKILFEIDEGSFSTNRITTISPPAYLSVDVFKPTTFASSTEASEDLDFGYEHPLTVIDEQTGVVALDTGARDKPYLLIPYAQKFGTRQQLSEWLGFLDRRQGRRIPFWISSWENDFVPVSLGTGINGNIDYRANGYASLIGVVQGRRDIAIHILRQSFFYNPGDQVNKRIASVSDIGGGLERLTLSTTDFASGDVDKIKVSFLRYCRLEADTVEIAWKSSCVSQTRVTLRETINDAP